MGWLWGEDNKMKKKMSNTELDTKNYPNFIEDNIRSSPLDTLYLTLPTF